MFWHVIRSYPCRHQLQHIRSAGVVWWVHACILETFLFLTFCVFVFCFFKYLFVKIKINKNAQGFAGHLDSPDSEMNMDQDGENRCNEQENSEENTAAADGFEDNDFEMAAMDTSPASSNNHGGMFPVTAHGSIAADEPMVEIEADEDITFRVPVSVLRLPASAAVLAPGIVPPPALVCHGISVCISIHSLQYKDKKMADQL